MRKAGLAVGIALAVSLVGVAFLSWTLWSGSSEAGSLPHERGPDEPTSEADSTIESATNSTSIPGSTSSASETLRDTLVEHRKPRDGPTVTFVEAESSRPRPDAAVWMVLDDQVTEEEWDGLERFDDAAEKLIEERGHFVELDDLATATLPGGDGNAMLFASADERRLRRSIPLDGMERMVLRLVRREAITILAADPNGRVQRDVPVSLQSLLRGETWQPPSRVVFNRPTDQDGEAVAPFGSELLDQHLDADGLATVRVVVAALAFPCRDPSATLVDPRLGCQAPVALVTAPRSTLRFHAVDSKGETLERDVIVEVGPAEPLASQVPVQRSWRSKIPAGRRAETTVEAEIDVHVDAWTTDGRFGMARVAELAPPVATTRELTLTLTENEVPVEAGWAVGRVRIIDEDRNPRASVEIHWQVDGGPTPRKDRLHRGTTDADGGLDFRFERLPSNPRGDSKASDAKASPHRLFDLFEGVEGPLSRGARRHGNTAFQDPPRGRTVDAGAVRLREIPLLVEGRVSDLHGHGIADVEVEVQEFKKEPRTKWTTRTGADGAFWVRSWTNCTRLEIWPSKPGWYRVDEYTPWGEPIPIEIAKGTRDLEITMRQKGFVRGRLLADPGISRRDLRIDALPKPAPDVRFRLDPDGRFYLEGVPSRRSLVVLALLGRDDPRSEIGYDQPIAQIDEVILEEGKETIDPRLDPIDLRGDLRQVELRVTSGDEPVFGASVFLTRQRGIRESSRKTDPFGRALVTTPTFDSALAVGSPFHLFALTTFDRGDHEVELRPAVVVRVSVQPTTVEVLKPMLNENRLEPYLDLEHADGGELFADLWEKLPPVERHRDIWTYEFLATVEGDYVLGWRVQDWRGDWRVARVRPETVAARGRAVLEVTEEFTRDEIVELSRDRRR